MKRGHMNPDVSSGWDWCEACSDRLQEMEPRLNNVDCCEFAARLWADESNRETEPEAAAERFLATQAAAFA